MKIYAIKGIITILLIFGLWGHNAFAQSGQCNIGGCSGGTLFPSSEQSNTTDAWSIVSTIIYGGEYAVYNVTLGKTYEWSLLSADGGSCSYDSQLTLLSEDGLTNYCFSDDVQNLNAKIQWTAPFTGKVRVLVNQYNCIINSINTTLVWRCASSSSITAPANDDCAGATSLSVYAGSTCAGSTIGNVLGATNSGLTSCNGTANNDVWYKFVATSAHFHNISVTGSADFDAVIDLRVGPSCPGTNVMCSDISGIGCTELLSMENLVVGQTYYVRVYDYYSSAPTTTDFTICITAPSTCEPTYSNGTVADDFINGVELTGENATSISNTNSGGGVPFVKDYTAQSTDLKAGFTYSLKLINGTYSGQTLAAWIDFNADGIYAADEKLGEFSNIDANLSVTIGFTVPAGADLGTTKILVRSVWSTTGIEPCTNYSYGEAEIYSVKIITPCVTPGTPVLSAASSVTSNSATISWSVPAGSPTITYFWAIGAASNVTYESNYLQRGSGASVTANLTSLQPGTKYYYTVKAVTSCNNTASNYTTVANFTTLCITPGTPITLSSTEISASSAKLNWLAGTPAGSPTVKYYWAVNTTSTVNYETNYSQRGMTSNLNAIVYNLNLNTQYYWTVKAVTDCGTSSASSYATNVNFTTLAIETPLTWIGVTSTDWNTITNWNPARVPTVSDNVIIPASCTYYPVITSVGLSINNTSVTNRCKSLTINNGASVSINTSGLYVYCSGDLNVTGALNYSAGACTNRFFIQSGGNVVVNQSGIINIGNMGITADRYNGIELFDGGTLSINGGTVIIMNTLKHQGTLNITTGHLYLKHYGGSGNNIPWDAYATSKTNISGGNVHISGVESGERMIDWNAAQSVNITGGDIILELKKHSSGVDNNANLKFGGHSIYNLTINRLGMTNTIEDVLDNGVIVKGNLTITNGTLANTTKNIKVFGDWINNGTYTCGTGTTTLSGLNNTIKGTNNTTFYNLVLDNNASYTIAPTTGDRARVNGNLTTNAGSVLKIASGKVLDFYGATAVINGDLIAEAANDNAIPTTNSGRDFDINNSASVSCTGIIQADTRILGGTTTLASNINLNGNVIIHTTAGATLNLSSYNLTTQGNWTNNGTFTAATGSVFFSGVNKTIDGANKSTFYNLSLLNGASYTLNSTLDRAEVTHTFISELNSNLTLAVGKKLSLLSSINTINGNISTDSTKYSEVNNTANFEIYIRRDNILSGSGTIGADVLLYKDAGISSVTTLGSNLTLDGSFWVCKQSGENAKLVLGAHTFTIAGNWISDGTFDSGTGTVVFNPTDNRTIRTFTPITNGNVPVDNNFYNLKIQATAGKTIRLVKDGTGVEHQTDNSYSGHLRVQNNLEVMSGIFSTGDNTGIGRKLISNKVTLVESGATLNIGGNSDESNWGNYVTTFYGDIILRGNIITTRPLTSGYAEIFLLGARLMGSGNMNEFGCDVQIHTTAITTQESDVYIQGDLIIQDGGTLKCELNKVLTVGGTFYLYNNLTHKGTVNVYGNMTSGSILYHNADVVNINTSIFNFIQSASKYTFLNKKLWFGQVNIVGGTRVFQQDIDCASDLTINSGATMNMFVTTPKNLSLSQDANFINNGTFVPYTDTVSFTGNAAQNITGNTQTTFYNLQINKSGSGVYPQNIAQVSNQLILSNGIFHTSSSKYISLLDQSSVAPEGGNATSFVNGPIFKTGRNGVGGDYSFVFPTGKNGIWARVATQHYGGTPATTDQFMAEYFDFPYPVLTFDESVYDISSVEYWNLSKISGDAGLQKKVKLYSEDKSRSGIASFTANADLTVAHFNTTTQKWEDIGLTASSETGNSGWVVSNFNANFSPFTFASKTGQNPLPVSLLSFGATLINKVVATKWVTASEHNTNYFILQKSKDMIDFVEVGTISAAGFSNELQNYQFDDNSPWDHISYYRLKIVDFDNSYTYSEAVAINNPRVIGEENTQQASSFELVSLYPNPVKDEFSVLVYAQENTKLTISITDLTGKLVYQNQLTIQKGDSKISLNATHFVNGFYILTLNNELDKISKKFVKQ